MKRFAAVLIFVLVLAMAFAPAAFASGLEITGITPSDGKTGLQTNNLAIKVKFSEDMTSTANDEANAELVKITSETDTDLEYSFQVAHSDKYPNELWFIMTGVMDSDTEYKVTIKSGVTATSGAKLTSDYTSTFKTRNTKTDSYVSIAMMIGMMVFMFFATSKAAKKNVQAQADPKLVEKQRAESLNPYKIAKEKNISVEEAQEYVAKEKAKLQKEQERLEAERAKREAARQAEIEAMEKKIEDRLAAQRSEYLYRVKGPKSITLTGREVPKAVIKAKKKSAQAKAARLKAEADAREANSRGRKSKK